MIEPIDKQPKCCDEWLIVSYNVGEKKGGGL